MIELIILACMVQTPETCKDVHLTFAGESTTPIQCMIVGEPTVATWAKDNPEWRIKKWRCGRPRDRKDDI